MTKWIKVESEPKLGDSNRNENMYSLKPSKRADSIVEKGDRNGGRQEKSSQWYQRSSISMDGLLH